MKKKVVLRSNFEEEKEEMIRELKHLLEKLKVGNYVTYHYLYLIKEGEEVSLGPDNEGLERFRRGKVTYVITEAVE